MALLVRWKGAGAALAVAASLAAPTAQAAIVHRYVAPFATGNGSGSDPSNRATLAWANANAVAGWVVHLSRGNYPAGIDPANGGTPAERIVYVGDDPVASKHVVNGIQLDGSADHVTVRGIRANGSLIIQALSGGTADFDSVVRCVNTGDVALRGANRAVIQACSLGVSSPSQFQIGAEGSATIGAVDSRIDGNVMLFSIDGTRSSDWRGCWFSEMERCTLSNNYLRMTIAPTAVFTSGATGHMKIYYGIRNNLFIDNRSDLYNQHAGSFNAYAFNLRDGCQGNTWVRDSTYDLGAYDLKVAFATNAYFQSNNSFTQTIFRIGMYFMWNCTGGADNVRFDHCQFIARNQEGNPNIGESMFYFIAGTYSNLSFDHCTFYNGGGRLWDTDNASPGWSTLRIRNCLFYSRPSGSDCSATRIMDPAQQDFDADNNLYFLAKQSSSDAPRNPSWTLRRSAGCAAPGPAGWPCTSFNNECGSRYADPVFTDTTWVDADIRRPDLQPASNSPAFGGAWPDGYVGALPASGQLDAVPPAGILNLGVGPAAAPPAAPSSTAPEAGNAGDARDPGAFVPPRQPGVEPRASAPAEASIRPGGGGLAARNYR
jgi:hypothetical protein